MNDIENSKTGNLMSANDNSVYDLKKQFKKYLKNWKWFALSSILCIISGFIYLRYATPEYNAYAKIMFLNDEGGTPASNILNDLKTFSDSEGKEIEDEIEVLKSRKLMSKVVKELDLNIQYYTKGRVHEKQIYPNNLAPIKVNFIASDSIIYNSSFSFSVNISSETEFGYKVEDGNKEAEFKKMLFGTNINTPIGDIVIIPNADDISNIIGQTLFVNVVPVFVISEAYKDKIVINPVDEFSKVIYLSLDDTVGIRAEQIINTLIDIYNESAIEEKNQRTKNTADFIDERINLIATDLAEADNQIEKFKTGNKLTDITSEADLYLNSSAQTDQELAQARTQLNQLKYMKDNVGSDVSSFEFIPSNIGMVDGAIGNLTTKYNDLLRQRNSLLNGSTKEKNPIILNLNQELISMRKSLSQSLDNSTKSLRLQIGGLQNRSDKINSKIYAVPGQVRKSKDMQRQQVTKESLYLYLLQKREEATISLTSTSPNARIIDSAYRPTSVPISPNKKIVYLASIIMGLCIPFGIIYIKDMLDNKIHNKEDLQKIIKDITVLGEIPRLKNNKNEILVRKNDRSVLSESFRIIRTNFDYVRRGRDVKEYDNVVFVTSTINGEGKSFFSMNMALTIANANKRVLLIGADIRNPQIFSAVKDKNNDGLSKIGLTEFLVDKSIILGETINEYVINDIKIDVLLSGKVPPNPAELLMNDRMKDLFDSVSSKYDYVIVDTAPAMLVTDTLLISEYAGHTIYLTRSDYTEKQLLSFTKELHADNKLNGMMLVVNDVKQSNFGYGAKYGYYGAPEKKSFFKRKKKL